MKRTLALLALASSSFAYPAVSDIIKNETLKEEVLRASIPLVIEKEQQAGRLPQGEISFDCTGNTKELCVDRQFTTDFLYNAKPGDNIILNYRAQLEITYPKLRYNYHIDLNAHYNSKTKISVLDDDDDNGNHVDLWTLIDNHVGRPTPTRDAEHQIPYYVEFRNNTEAPYDVRAKVLDGHFSEMMYQRAKNHFINWQKTELNLPDNDKFYDWGHNVHSVTLVNNHLKYEFVVNITDDTGKLNGKVIESLFRPSEIEEI